MFYRIHDDVTKHFPSICKTRHKAARKVGMLSYIKVLACLGRLRTARPLDDLGDSAEISPETSRQYLKSFYECVMTLYGS